MNARKLLLLTSAAMTMISVSGLTAAQDKAGYWTSPASGNAVWKNGSGQCWRAGYWTPAMANAECDPDLMPKAAPAPPPPTPRAAPAPAAKPAAKPAAAKPPVLKAVVGFAFNDGNIGKGAERQLDESVIAKLPALGALKYMNVSGHADRLGSPQYNQKLSERRANSVKDYLVKKGVDASKIETFGYGKTMPIKSCPDDKNQTALRACLDPNRRVEIEAEGTAK